MRSESKRVAHKGRVTGHSMDGLEGGVSPKMSKTNLNEVVSRRGAPYLEEMQLEVEEIVDEAIANAQRVVV